MRGGDARVAWPGACARPGPPRPARAPRRWCRRPRTSGDEDDLAADCARGMQPGVGAEAYRTQRARHTRARDGQAQRRQQTRPGTGSGARVARRSTEPRAEAWPAATLHTPAESSQYCSVSAAPCSHPNTLDAFRAPWPTLSAPGRSVITCHGRSVGTSDPDLAGVGASAPQRPCSSSPWRSPPRPASPTTTTRVRSRPMATRARRLSPRHRSRRRPSAHPRARPPRRPPRHRRRRRRRPQPARSRRA